MIIEAHPMGGGGARRDDSLMVFASVRRGGGGNDDDDDDDDADESAPRHKRARGAADPEPAAASIATTVPHMPYVRVPMIESAVALREAAQACARGSSGNALTTTLYGARTLTLPCVCPLVCYTIEVRYRVRSTADGAAAINAQSPPPPTHRAVACTLERVCDARTLPRAPESIPAALLAYACIGRDTPFGDGEPREDALEWALTRGDVCPRKPVRADPRAAESVHRTLTGMVQGAPGRRRRFVRSVLERAAEGAFDAVGRDVLRDGAQWRARRLAHASPGARYLALALARTPAIGDLLAQHQRAPTAGAFARLLLPSALSDTPPVLAYEGACDLDTPPASAPWPPRFWADVHAVLPPPTSAEAPAAAAAALPGTPAFRGVADAAAIYSELLNSSGAHGSTRLVLHSSRPLWRNDHPVLPDAESTRQIATRLALASIPSGNGTELLLLHAAVRQGDGSSGATPQIDQSETRGCRGLALCYQTLDVARAARLEARVAAHVVDSLARNAAAFTRRGTVLASGPTCTWSAAHELFSTVATATPWCNTLLVSLPAGTLLYAALTYLLCDTGPWTYVVPSETYWSALLGCAAVCHTSHAFVGATVHVYPPPLGASALTGARVVVLGAHRYGLQALEQLLAAALPVVARLVLVGDPWGVPRRAPSTAAWSPVSATQDLEYAPGAPFVDLLESASALHWADTLYVSTDAPLVLDACTREAISTATRALALVQPGAGTLAASALREGPVPYVAPAWRTPHAEAPPEWHSDGVPLWVPAWNAPSSRAAPPSVVLRSLAPRKRTPERAAQLEGAGPHVAVTVHGGGGDDGEEYYVTAHMYEGHATVGGRVPAGTPLAIWRGGVVPATEVCMSTASAVPACALEQVDPAWWRHGGDDGAQRRRVALYQEWESDSVTLTPSCVEALRRALYALACCGVSLSDITWIPVLREPLPQPGALEPDVHACVDAARLLTLVRASPTAASVPRTACTGLVERLADALQSA